MLSTQQLLQFLKENTDGYVSGEEIAQRMAVTRTAVWNHVQELRLLGYEVEAVPHRGYRLTGVPDRLMQGEIVQGLRTGCFGKEVHVYDSVPSTNNAAMAAAQKGAQEGTAIFAETQTKGRGRLGRLWHSPRGKGLWFSVVLRPKLSMDETPRITLAAAVGVAEALRRHTDLDIRIKWPNDLYLGERKLGGILTEIETDLQQVRCGVLGVGINVNGVEQDFPEELRATATSLRIASGKSFERNALARTLLEELEGAYRQMLQEGFDPIRRRWSRLSMTTGRWVRVQTHPGRGDELNEGIAEGVDGNGCLILRGEGGQVRHVISGDVLLGEN